MTAKLKEPQAEEMGNKRKKSAALTPTVVDGGDLIFHVT